MGYRILALLENNVATIMLLTSRLERVGHRLVIVSSVGDFEQRLEAEPFDWVVLDGTVVRGARGRIRSILAHRLGGARIAWIGEPPRFADFAIASRFSKPPSYDAIVDSFGTQEGARENGSDDTRRPDSERRVSL